MRSLIAITGILVLIAALIPAASAFYGCYEENNQYSCQYHDYFQYKVYNVSDLINGTDQANHTAFCNYIGKTDNNNGFLRFFSAQNTTASTEIGMDVGQQVTALNQPYAGEAIYCGGSTPYWYYVRTFYRFDMAPTPPVADFYATPTQGTGPVDISFFDNSTSDLPITNYSWMVSPLTGWAVNPSDLDNEDIVIRFTANGNYTITHNVTSAAGSDSEVKVEYIWIHDSNATITTPFTAIDLAFAHPITGANISLYDIGNSSWTNSTTGSDGKVSITTLQGHYINGYATAAGYDDADLLGVDAYAGGHTFYMYPQGYTNVSEWNVTVFINVVDDSDFGVPLTGVTVTGMYGSTSQTQTSDSAGIARFVFPNSTDIHFGATKAGYAGTTITLNTGIPSGGSAAITGTIHMFKGAVTTAPTPTTLPGGGTPTVTITVDPYPCVGDGSYQDTLNCQRKQGEMGADLIAYGPDLVKFFIMLTFVGGLALMGKGFK